MQQLQDFLNECIKRGWKPRGFKVGKIVYNGMGRLLYIGGWEEEENQSVHDLFSVESGLMEFVKWKTTEQQYVERDGFRFLDNFSGKECVAFKYIEYRQQHYMEMSMMNAEQKIVYFLENAYV